MRFIGPPLLLLVIGLLQSQGGRWVPTEHWLTQVPHYNQRPKDGYVRDKKTALVIGKAVLAATFSQRLVDKSGPYDAKLFENVWVVYSYFPEGPNGPQAVGGVATVEMDKTSGAILRVSSEQ